MSTPQSVPHSRQKAPRKPGFLGWAFALTSLLLAAGVGAVGLITQADRDSQRTYQHLDSLLNGGRFVEAKLALETRDHVSPIERLLDSEASAVRERVVQVAREATLLAEQASVRNSTAFNATYKRVDENILSLPETYSAVKADWEEARLLIEEQIANVDRVEVASDRIRELEDEQAATREQFTQAAVRFAALLGLPKDDASGEPATYTGGVFEGLPALARLPDGLTSLTEARDAISAIGGGVIVKGPRAHEDFAAEVETIKAILGPLKTRLSSNNEELQTLKAERSAAIPEFTEHGNVVRARLIPIILQLVSPPRSWAERLFNVVKSA